ncbi:MAG: serine hydrolase domain-containing protein [Pseudomonadota bacterium]
MPMSRNLLLLPIVIAMGTACSDGSDSSASESAVSPTAEPAAPVYSFDEVDTELQRFIDESQVFDGISYTLVDGDQGMVHEAAFGDHTLDTVVQLASTSKMPSVALLMALHEDESLDFDIAAPIERYLPWEGVYGDRTTEQLLSNTSGIPGLGSIATYGVSGHICQFAGNTTLQECGETLYVNESPGSTEPGTAFDYGGSQWHLAGAVAEVVSNSTWNQAFDVYIGTPCELEVFTYGNMWSNLDDWTGSPDSLTGQENANVEGGGITTLQDYAKLLLMHLRGGACGDNQVLSQDSVDFVQTDRGGPLGGPGYGMGWWIIYADEENNELIYDPGAFGAVSWLDVERGIGGYVAIDDYTRTEQDSVYDFVLNTVVPLQRAVVDAARDEVGE